VISPRAAEQYQGAFLAEQRFRSRTVRRLHFDAIETGERRRHG
jgi:hypothetical protein